jgi:DNA ligase-1
MPDLQDGQTAEVKGSGSSVYTIKNVGGVYSCSCPAWRNQHLPIEQRTCKHIIKFRGADAEQVRLGAALTAAPRKAAEKEAKEPAPVLLAEPWDTVTDVRGWWMSEKLDGQRAYWDGKQFWSRLGNLIHVPDWFLAGLPPVPLDGEMWLGRGQFQRTSGLVRRQDKHEFWREIKYVIFDAPAQDDPFEARLQFLQGLLRRNDLAHVQLLEQKQCQSIDHLRQELEAVEALGGEGLMLRMPGSKYVAGRSATLLKVKTFHDAEATVVGYQAGAGRHKGRMGALQVVLDSGVRFEVGTGFSDAERANPPPVGSRIRFRYQELTEAGIPRFPSYLGLRDEAGPSTAPTAPLMSVTRSVSVSVSGLLPEPSAKPAPAATSAAPGGGGGAEAGKRHFEFVGGTSYKFWEVWVAGKQMFTRYGRIGSQGTVTVKEYADEAAARKAADKLIAEKTGKGYAEKK